VTDISTQKRSEKIALDRAEALEQARVSEERFKRCMDHSPFGTMIADVTKGVQYVNEAWWELSQHARVPLEQIDWNSVLHEDDIETADQGWQVSEEFRISCCDLLIHSGNDPRRTSSLHPAAEKTLA
jgi:PAS domain-containing protein